MVDHTSAAKSPPGNWQDFERHSRLLFQFSLDDPGVLNNGRSGQRQHGVDIYGRRGGGSGPVVGIQCKGKNGDYGKKVTEKELRAELEETKKFKPALSEFILITTVLSDALIQEAARLLEVEQRAAGRNISVQVWGWDRVLQEINRWPETIDEFHPDSSPFTGKILNEERETQRLVQQTSQRALSEIGGLKEQIANLAARIPGIVSESTGSIDAFDRELNSQIDGYRDDLIRGHKPRTALGLLEKMRERIWDTASNRIRFRILTNIGAAHYNLNDYEKAADFLLEASQYNPDDPGSRANKVAALVIKGRKEEAYAEAVAAVAAHPDNADIAQQRLQARGPGETVDDVWQSLPDKARSTGQAYVIRAATLREADNPRWVEVAAEALQKFPDDVGVRVLHAEGVVESFQKADPGAVGVASSKRLSIDELKVAAETLEECYRDSTGQESPPKFACAHNAALAWFLVGDVKRSAELLDSAISGGFGDNEALHNRIMLYRRNGQLQEARRLADRLDDSPVSKIIRADLFMEANPDSARAMLADRGKFTWENDVVSAALVVIESFVKEGKFEAAEEEAHRLEAVLPRHPQGQLALFRIRKARGDDSAGAALDLAFSLVREETDFPTRFLVANALKSVHRHDDVVDLLQGKTSTALNSPALQALIASAINADRRVLARQLLDEIPSSVAQLSFYRKARIALETRTGNIAVAELLIRALLADEPDNVEMQLQLLWALFRQNKLEEIRVEAAKSPAQFKGVPEDFMKLAQFMDDFGDWKSAHALGYQTLLKNPTSHTVAMGYVVLFLRPGHSRKMEIDPKAIEPDMAVQLEMDNGTKPIFIIETDAQLRPTPQYISSDHQVAKLLIGKHKGDPVELPDGSSAMITWIKPKELHALHDLLENFGNRFPEMRGLQRIRVEFEKKGGLEPMLAKIRDRHDAIEEINKLYEAGALPLALVGRAVGCDPIEALIGIAGSGIRIRSCDGSQVERDTAFAAIEANAKKGCIIDLATFHIIRRLKLESAVVAVCGPIGIVGSTTMYYQGKIHELRERIDQPDMSIAYRDGQYYRTEATPEEKQRALSVAEADRNWLEENANVIPAEGTADLSSTWRPLIAQFGGGFLDELRAAQSSGKLFLSEDQLLRQLGLLDFRVAGAWLQPVLMRALSQNVITLDEYRNSVLQLIDVGLEFVSVSPDLLVSSLRGANDIALPEAFKKLASRVGGKRADLLSHVEVALSAVLRVWRDETLSGTLRQAALGHLLERLIADRSSLEVAMIMVAVAERDPWPGSGHSLRRYVEQWLRGHFITLAPPRAEQQTRSSSRKAKSKHR